MDQYGIDELRQSMIKILDSKSQQVVGSGFVIHSDGYLVTCHHVIYLLDLLRVVYQGKIYEAKWCEELSNPEVDIAILKIEVANAKAVRIIEPYTLEHPALIYGFPHSKLEKFPEGFDVPAQNIELSVPLSTRQFFTKNSSLTNPWNRLPESISTFESYRIRKSVDAGTSGGPVLVNVLRGVIGVVQCSSKGKEETYIIRWGNIKEKLEILEIGVQKQEIYQDVPNTDVDLNSNFKEEYIKLISNISSRTKSNSNSSKRLDLINLKKYLNFKKLQEADNETDYLILRAVNKERHSLITEKDLSKLDFSIIYDIDCLWRKYSDNKFGFIVQHVIWNTLNNQSNKFDLHILAENVGWRSNDKWLDYNQFTFSLEEAKKGHLPSFGYNMQPLHDWISSYKNFFSYVRKHLQ